MNYNFPSHISGDTWDGISSITILSQGLPMDLTDCNITLQVRSANSVASPVFIEFSTIDDTIVIIEPLSGIIFIPPRTINIPVGRYNYDLQVTFPILPNAYTKTYLKGEWEILTTTTR
jgi:hypothetical protein